MPLISRRGRHFAVASAISLALCGGATTLPASASPAPGSDGAGDTYFPKYGNGGYDVLGYYVAVRYEPNTGRLNGKTKIRLAALHDLSSLNLDLVLPASRVAVDGRSVKFRAGAHELTVTPDAPILQGQAVTVAVTYAGTPADVHYNGESPWITTPDGAVALGQPEIAPWWFPSNDHPTDKAHYRIDIKVPAGLEAISNGHLDGRVTAGGWTTWRWRLSSQAATYLVFAAIGNYDIERGVAPSGRPYVHAFGDRVGADARRSIRFTDRATTFLEQYFGPYPFEQIGGVVPNGRSFSVALETQTRPVYSKVFFDWGTYRTVVIHEIAHQWFGDSVAVHRWKNIWLNEGFATYAEWLWEQREGAPPPPQRLQDTYDQIPADDPFWRVKIGDPGPRRLFHDAVYDRGAMTVQALRNRVGPDAFFQVLHTWLTGHRDGTGTTQQFLELAEQISGEDLDGFFTAWLFSRTRPAHTPENGF